MRVPDGVYRKDAGDGAIEIEICQRCGGTLRVIASIEQPDVIEPILDHLGFHSNRPIDDPEHTRYLFGSSREQIPERERQR